MTSSNNQTNNESTNFWKKVARWIPIPLLAVVLTFIGSTILTQYNSNNNQDDFTYRVLITDIQNDKPISNALVIIDTKNTPSPFTKRTDNLGIASFDMDGALTNQAAGINVDAVGYINRTISVSLSPNNRSQGIALTPEQIVPEVSTRTPTSTKQPSSTPSTNQETFVYQVIVQTNDNTRIPISGAEVTLQVFTTDGNSPVPSNEETDANGIVRFILPAGFLNNAGKLTARAEGFATQEHNIDLFTTAASKTINLELNENNPPESTKTTTPTEISILTETSTPTATTISAVTSTPTREIIIPTSTPISPQPISPNGTTQKNPITFTWSGPANLSYTIKLTNPTTGWEHTMSGISNSTNEWVFMAGIPGDAYGEIHWMITSSAGGQSSTVSFFFDPFPSNGNPDPTFTPPP